MSPSAPTDAVAFHSEIAPDFHASYDVDPNRMARTAVWRQYIAKYVTPGRLAYDLGCGSGMVTCEIAPYAQQVLAIDGSDSMLAIAKKTTAERGFANVAFRQSRLPIAAPHDLEVADIVISSSVIEYLDSVEDTLAFIRGILKPSGILIFSISNRDSFKRQAVKVFNRITGRPRYFGLLKHFLSVNDIREALEKTGFVLLDSTYFDGRDRFNRLLGSVLPEKHASNMILAVAQRVDAPSATRNAA